MYVVMKEKKYTVLKEVLKVSIAQMSAHPLHSPLSLILDISHLILTFGICTVQELWFKAFVCNVTLPDLCTEVISIPSVLVYECIPCMLEPEVVKSPSFNSRLWCFIIFHTFFTFSNIWPGHMTVYDGVWRCMMVYDGLWQYMTVYDSGWGGLWGNGTKLNISITWE